MGKVSDHEDANLAGEVAGSGDVGYGRDGSENCSEDKGVVWACWLSPRPDLSVLCPFPRSIGSLGTDDSGMYGMSACHDPGSLGSVSMGASSVGWESGTWATGVVGLGVGW